MITDDDIEGIEYEHLQEYIENGRQGEMPHEMVEYLSQLEVVRGQINRNKGKEFIVNLLKAAPYSLTDYHARKRYADAVNFFYLDTEVKKEAWRNLYADKLEKAANLVLQTATNSRDLDVYKNILLAAANMRGLNEPDKEELPEELFQRPIKIYTTDVKILDIPEVSRTDLIRKINSYEISEIEKERLKGEALITSPKLFLTDEQRDSES